MRIVKAHRVQKLLVEDFLDCLRIAGFERGVQSGQLFRLRAHLILEPRKHLLLKDVLNLAVRDAQRIDASVRIIDRRKVARHVEQAPQIFNVRVDFGVRQVFVERLRDRFTLDQPLDFQLLRAVAALLNEPPHHVVAAGIDPVRLRLRLRIKAQRVDVIEYVPRAIHILLAEAVAIVPRAGFLVVVFQTVIREQLANLLVGEAEVFVEAHVRDRMHHQIVQSREDALL